MLAPNLRPQVVPHSGSRLLPGRIVRARGRLAAGEARGAAEARLRSPTARSSPSSPCSPGSPASAAKGTSAASPRRTW